MYFPASLLCSVPIVILQIENDDDRQFVMELYQQYKFIMFKTAYNIVEDTHTAEDLVQDCCITIIDNLGKIRGVEPCKQRAYIVSIVKNCSINYVVKRNRRSKYSFLSENEQVFDGTVSDESVDDRLLQESDIESVRKALLKLSERDRTILRMKYFDQLSDKEIASYLEIKIDSVRYYFTLARRQLKAVLSEMECL